MRNCLEKFVVAQASRLCLFRVSTPHPWRAVPARHLSFAKNLLLFPLMLTLSPIGLSITPKYVTK